MPAGPTDQSPHYDEWNRRYQARGAALNTVLSQAIAKALESEHLDDARTILRAERAMFPYKFCLLLYGSGLDDALAAQILKAMETPPSEEEWQQARASVARSERTPRVMTLLMFLLDVDDIHTLMLERESDAPPDGPLRFRPPDHFWFPSFGLIAELAHVIIVIGNIGANLIRETRYLADAGLDGRVLLYAGAEVYEFVSGKSLAEQKVWPLDTDGLRAAVLHASTAVARAPSVPFAVDVFGDEPNGP